MTTQDSRKFKRLSFDKPVELYPVFPLYQAKGNEGAKAVLAGRLTNIGGGGVGLVADSPLRAGSVLKLHFELKEDRWIEVFGKIAWAKDGSAGVEFFSLTRIPQRTIKRYISEISPG